VVLLQTFLVSGTFGDVLDSFSADDIIIDFRSDKSEYITWDRLRLYLAVESVSGAMNTDVYLAIMLPDGGLFGIVPDLSFSGLNVDKGTLYAVNLDRPEKLVPAIRDVAAGSGTIFSRTLVYKAVLDYGLNLAEGDYQVLAMACLAGTLTPVAFSTETFRYEPQTCTVSGHVFDEHGPASSATVKIQTTPNTTLSDSNGRFRLGGVPCGKTVRVSGWKYQHYCAVVEATPPTVGVILHVDAITQDDNEAYEWLAPDPVNLEQDFCINCHPPIYKQWSVNFHALSASNEIFQTLYSGTDVYGNPGVGLGYKLDFPDTAGSCALCHAPVAALQSPYHSDMSNLTGLGQRGVFCEFCHKIVNVELSNLMTVYGVNAIEFTRPFPGERQVFYGPNDDADGDTDTLLPLIRKSEFCAPCHACEFWGVPVYTSFPEWEASEYKTMGIQCQACHYRPDGITTNYAPLSHGQERDPNDIPSHLIMGEENLSLHYESATLSISASKESDDRLVTTVEVSNAFAGHHLPTGRPIRNIILLVEAFDSHGAELEFIDGEIVPVYGGAGGGPRDFAGRPGKMFAKILVDQLGNHPAPSWRQTMILSDSRIPALESDFSTYGFLLPEGTTCATVDSRLLYRRAFKELEDTKGWDLEDILMTSETETFHFGGD